MKSQDSKDQKRRKPIKSWAMRQNEMDNFCTQIGVHLTTPLNGRKDY